MLSDTADENEVLRALSLDLVTQLTAYAHFSNYFSCGTRVSSENCGNEGFIGVNCSRIAREMVFSD
jgi:hypothetical protein